jgi:hypothetical protein
MTEIRKPTTHLEGVGQKWTNETYCYDGSTGGDEITMGYQTIDLDEYPSIRFHIWQTKGYTYTSTILKLKWKTSIQTGDDEFGIEYTKNGGSNWNDLVIIGVNRSVSYTTAQTILDINQDLTQVEVRVNVNKVKGGDGCDLQISDIWTEGEYSGDVVEQVSLLDENIVPYATTETAGAMKKVSLLHENIIPYAVTTKVTVTTQVNLLTQNIVPYAVTTKIGVKLSVSLLVQNTVPYAPTLRVDNQVATNLIVQKLVPYVVTTKTGVKLSTSLLVQDIIPYAIILNVDNKVTVNPLDQSIVPYAAIPSGGGVVKVVNLLEQKIIQLAAKIPQYVTDGLLCYWKMDETGGVTLVDNEGNVNMNLNGNYTLGVPGKLNTAVEFEDDTVTYAKSAINPSALMSLAAFSVEFWIKMYSWEDSSPYISGLINLGDANYFPLNVRFGDSSIPKERLQFLVRTLFWDEIFEEWLAEVKKIKADANSALNTWYHVILTWDSNNKLMKMYVNTQLQIENGATQGDILHYYPYGSDYLWFACDNHGLSPNRTLDGVLDEIRFYDRVLTQDEVNQNYYVSEVHFKTFPLTQKIVPGAVNAIVSGNLHKAVSLLTQKIFPHEVTPESYDIIRECLSTLINPRPMFKINTKSRNMFSTKVSAKKFMNIKTTSRKEDI